MLKIGASSVGAGEKKGRQNVQEGRRFGQDLVPPPPFPGGISSQRQKSAEKGRKREKKGESLGKGKKGQSKGPKGKTEGNREKRGE